ncbi:alcohol dehydrogenase [Saccharospirillum sp. MSK14-1]|uniref:iron-containing alcohol dehydrogenase n=1 Tax=Saccharospirillum sp. MSK14-1 TaxID=1897632 RepID=UPI000D3BAD92|nr:iron-containing alcohol dehydrogenase [Saccharospirillum sp. MSK14-1]PTY38733.1 alcohol dehydrogenase [Saccharospirillum sp. MSK14-1]
MTHRIVLPRLMETGAGAVQQVPALLQTLGCKKPLLITDPIMVQLGHAARLQDILATANIASDVFADTMAEPTEDSLLPAVEQVKAGDFDALIALGGGSAIDSAKAIAILGKHGGQMADYKVPRIVDDAGLPVIAIPTTAGTGSEATRVTIITDAKTDEKMLCMGLGFMPVAAVIDYELSMTAPARVTADTGIDALTHGIEAYVSQKANPFSDQQALAAIELIAPNLRRVYHNPDDKPAREAMMLGATLAGVAFSNASVALVHGMSRPIGAHFHVPHGLSNAMLLPAITEWSIPAAEARYATCARTMGIATASDSDAAANAQLLVELKALNDELKVPTPAGFGIEESDFFGKLELMAGQALASGSPGNNPRVPTADEIVTLYQTVWNQS